MITSWIGFLLFLVIAGLIIWWTRTLPLPAWVHNLIYIIFAIFCLLALVSLLTGHSYLPSDVRSR